MLIEIVAGKGIGQKRVIIESKEETNPTFFIPPSWEIIPNTTSVYQIAGPTVKILEWDPVNDRNNDAWVDDYEFLNLANPKATARAR